MVGRADLEAVLKLNDKMSGTLQKIEKSVDKFGKTSQKSMDKTNTSIDKVVKNFTRLAIGIGSAIAVAQGFKVLVRTIKLVVEASSRQEDAVKGVEASLLATGRAVATTSAELQAFARHLQGITRFGDEVSLSAVEMLAQLTTLDSKGLQKALETSIGLAETFGFDLKQSAILVGKSIGSTTNALIRYGIQIDAQASQQEKLNQMLVNAGTFFEVATQKAKTFSGLLARLTNAWGDLLETLGDIITQNPQVLGLLDGLRIMVERVIELFKADDFQMKLSLFIMDMLNWAERVGVFFLSISGVVNSALSSIALALANLLILFSNLLDVLRGNQVFKLFPELLAWLEGLDTFLLNGADRLTAWASGLDASSTKANTLRDTFRDMITDLQLLTGFGLLPPDIAEPEIDLDPTRTLMETLLGQLATFWSEEFQKGMGNAIGNALATGGDVMGAIGQTLAQTISTGIQGATGGVFGGIASALGPVSTAFLGPVVGGLATSLLGGLFGKKKKKAPTIQPVRVVNFEDLTGELLRASSRRRVGPPQINGSGQAGLSMAFSGEARV